MKERACASVRLSGGSLRGAFRRRRLAPGSRTVRQSDSEAVDQPVGSNVGDGSDSQRVETPHRTVLAVCQAWAS